MAVSGYVRVSRVAGREGERFISPSEQRRAIEGWAKLHGRAIGSIFEDLDQSGKKRHRPGLDEAMAEVVGGESDGIVVAKLDRFGRSVSHLGELLDQLAAHDAALFTVAEGIDTSGRAGRMIASIMSAVAEFEVHRQGESWFTARSAAVGRGVFVGGTVPLGYEKDDTGRLRPSSAAPVVREAFTRRAAGQSWTHIADWLAGEVGGQWSVGAVRYMLTNRTYLGEIHGGQGIVNVEGHEAIVDRATFEAARVTGVAPAASGRGSGLLSGILRCANCRYALKPSMRVGGALDYRCKGSRRENAARCREGVSISAARVDPYVVGEYFRHLGNYRALNVDNAADVRLAADLLAEAEAERDAALDGRLRELVDSDAFLRVVGERQAAVERARDRLSGAKRAGAGLPDVDLESLWPDISMIEQRHVLSASLDAVFVRRGDSKQDLPGRLHFVWAGSDVELPVRGQRWTPKPFEFPG